MRSLGVYSPKEGILFASILKLDAGTDGQSSACSKSWYLQPKAGVCVCVSCQ